MEGQATVLDVSHYAASHQTGSRGFGNPVERLSLSMPQLHPTAENGNNPKVVQDLRRHATYNITANTYDAAVSEEKREAHCGVLATCNPYRNPYHGGRW